MGIVTDTLIALLKTQVHERNTVVWYDSTGEYAEVAAALTAEQVGAAEMHRYSHEDGFFKLRHALEPAWGPLNLDAAPRLLVYVPLAQSNTHHALLEYEVGGVVVQPGEPSAECNSELSSVARRALATIFPEARLTQIVEEVAAHKLSLAELDQLAGRGAEAQTGTLTVIFGTGNATEVMLRFLADDSFDASIAGRHAEKDVAKVFADSLGVDFGESNDCRELRARAARQILATEFFSSLQDPAFDSPIPLASQAAALEAAADLARQWRNRRDIAPSYVKLSAKIESEIAISTLDLSLDVLAKSATFAVAEMRLQTLVEEALVKRPTAAVIDIVRQRIGGFWSSQKPEIKTRWEVVYDAGSVLQEVGRIETALKGKQWSASKLFAEYAYGDTPWCTLDTAQRHLERDIYRYDFNLQAHGSLHQLTTRASQQYASMINRLAELFVTAYKDESFELRDIQIQGDIYRDFVAPLTRSGRVAYVLVDAFRYEMAREFVSLLQANEPTWRINLTPALATPPTITDVGMAALMPGAEDGLTLTLDKSNNLIPNIGGKPVRTAKARLERIAVAVGAEPVVTTLDEIAPLLKASLSRKLNEAQLVVVTASDDIDGLGENMPQKARRSMDEVLSLLRRGLAALVNAGIQHIVIVADHGFILADRLDDSQKIDAPGDGLLKRRVWVGVGGDSHNAVIRTSLSSFGIGGKLELVTPIGLSAFKVAGGNMEYFHGGLALQEIVIPVLVVSPTPSVSSPEAPKLNWILTLGSQKITSPYISVTLETAPSMFPLIDAPTVRAELRASQQVLSVPISASYGFQDATKDVRLSLNENKTGIEKNTITLYLSEKPSTPTVELHLLDANTGVTLHSVKPIDVIPSLFD